MREETVFLYGETRGDESRTSGRRKPETAFSFARRGESSSESGSSRRVHGRTT